MLSDLNKRIIKSFKDMDDVQKKQFSILEKIYLKERWFRYLRLMMTMMIGIISMISNKETKKVIPSSGQGITVNKRIVKLGELTPSKNKVIENEKINIDTEQEQVTIKYPDDKIGML
jgi:hypothetical protein